MNNKLQTASVSLIGAIPGIALSVILIMAFFNHMDKMSAMYRTLTGVTLTVSVCIAVLPFAIIIFGPKAEKSGIAAEPQPAPAEEEIHPQEPEEELAFDDDSDEFEETHNESEEFFNEEPVAAVESGDVSDEDDLDIEDDLFMEGDEEEFDFFDEEEES